MAAGDKKYGRNKTDAQRYKASNTLERNKRKTAERHANRMAKKAAHRAKWEARQAVKARPFSEPHTRVSANAA